MHFMYLKYLWQIHTKPQDVIKILKDNQVKLCAYLKTLHADKAHVDAQFRDERALIIATIEAL